MSQKQPGYIDLLEKNSQGDTWEKTIIFQLQSPAEELQAGNSQCEGQDFCKMIA